VKKQNHIDTTEYMQEKDHASGNAAIRMRLTGELRGEASGFALTA